MRRATLPCCALAALILAGCGTGDSADGPDDPVGTAESAIAYGTPDSAHTAVVSLLGNVGNGSFDECSGTIVQVKNGAGYVLTAAHCCDMTAPSIVVMSSDYAVGEQYLGGNPQPPAYPVTAGSVYWDSKYVPNTGSAYDFCMLKFAAPANAPVIPVAQPGQDGLALGVEVEHVGFGETDTNSGNSGRRTGTAPVNLALTATTLQSSQGGASHVQGVCEGDSGGPALVPAGAAQSQQKVVGTTSTGDATSCATNTENTCMRVTSETGPGGFISNYLDDDTTGGLPGGNTPASCGLTTMDPTCDDCIDTSCCAQAQACASDPSCPACASSGCSTDPAAGALVQCLQQHCATPCGGGSSSSSSGGTGCGLTSNMAACTTCLDASCCSQAQACSTDTSCTACLSATPPPTCGSEANFVALGDCLAGSCAAPCGISTSSTSSSSSSSTSSSSSSSSGSSSTSSGGGAGGAGASSSGGSTGSKGGCSCRVAGEEAPAPPASLACLIGAAALAFAQRRRARRAS